MTDDAQTRPTIETILKRIEAMETRLNIRLDRIEAEVKATHSEMFTLRVGFVGFRTQFKQPA